MKKFLISMSLMCLSLQGMMAQLVNPLSLIEHTEGLKIYEVSLQEDKLYVAASDGLYSVGLEQSSYEWSKMAFTDELIRKFVVRGDTVIALADTSLYVSVDGGKTANNISIDAIAPGWKDNPLYNDQSSLGSTRLMGFAVHPQNATDIYVAYRGLSRTKDAGMSWEVVYNLGDMMFEGIRYNPLDTQNLIAYTNEDMKVNKNSKVYVSTNMGMDWSRVYGFYASSSTIVKDVVFHPADKNKIMLYGDGIYASSTDQGHTWRTIGEEHLNPDMGIIPSASLDGLVYDKRSPNVLYGSDLTTTYEADSPKIRLLRSVDGGLSWNTFYVIDNTILVKSMSMCDNLLAIVTAQNEIYLLDVDEVASVSPVTGDAVLTPYYDLQGRKVSNPTRGIYIKDGKKVIIGQ